MKNKPIELTIVATIFNSEPIISKFIHLVISAADSLNIPYEIILVDDGSKDKSALIIENECKKNSLVKAIILSRNFGQQIAMTAGINFATGKYVLIMDGDLQNPPEAIPELYIKIKKGFDIVFTKSLVKNNFIDSFTSFLFWKFLGKIMRVDITQNQLMMRIMTSDVTKQFNKYPEKIRTIAAITHDIGMRTAVLAVNNRKRISGKSNYNLFKRLHLAFDVIIDTSNTPLYFIFNFGLFIFLFTFIISNYYLYMYITKNILPGFISLILVAFFFGSTLLMALGIIARYIANIFSEIKFRPIYIIRKSLNIKVR
jgi:dolichol-phosphate mannosyltransferase